MSRFQDAGRRSGARCRARRARRWPAILPGRGGLPPLRHLRLPVRPDGRTGARAGLTVDQIGFDAAMAAQRAISRGGAAFKDEPRDRAELYVDLRAGPDRVPRLRRRPKPTRRSSRCSVPTGAVEEAEAGRRGRGHPRPHAVLRRVGRPDRRHRHDPHRNRGDQHRRHLQADARPLRASRHRGRGVRPSRRTGARRDRRRAAAGDPAQSHRDAPAPPGAADGARRGNAPGRFAGRARPAAVRLHQPRSDDGRAGRAGRRDRQRRDLAQRPGDHRDQAVRRGGRGGRDGALRREVRRQRARGRRFAASRRSSAAARTSRTPARSGRS